MAAFQYISLGPIALLIIATLTNIFRRRSRDGLSFFWLTLWIVAAAALLDPPRTSAVARTLGIERGADLVSYCAVLGGLVGFFLVWMRLRALDRQITLMVREVALLGSRLSTVDMSSASREVTK